MPPSAFTIPARADEATPELYPVWQTKPKPCVTCRVYSRSSNVRSLGYQSWSVEQAPAGSIPRQDDSIDDYSSDLSTSASWYDAILSRDQTCVSSSVAQWSLRLAREWQWLVSAARWIGFTWYSWFGSLVREQAVLGVHVARGMLLLPCDGG